jgi:RimJ/RimL family protein N-acetyltransferase
MALPSTLPTLRTAHLVLREFRDDDVDMIREAATDKLIPAITSVPATYSDAAGLAYIERNRSRVSQGVGYSFAIADATSDQPLGQIGVWLRDLSNGRVSIGYWVRPATRGRGIATNALRMASPWAICFPEIARVELYVELWNTASWTVAEKAGFRREGLLRSWQEISGTRRDMYMYALLPDDLQR